MVKNTGEVDERSTVLYGRIITTKSKNSAKDPDKEYHKLKKGPDERMRNLSPLFFQVTR
jgi:hypothetical protein